MSASLHFPKYLSDIIISKGVAHIEPEWNFTVSNGKFTLNLVWPNVSTDHLIMSPPPFQATQHPPTGYNYYVHPTHVREPPIRNQSNIPPRFLNKRYKGKSEKPFCEHVVTNKSDESLQVKTEVMKSDSRT